MTLTRRLLAVARVLIVLALITPGTYFVLRGFHVAEVQRPPAASKVAPRPPEKASVPAVAIERAPSTLDCSSWRPVYAPLPKAPEAPDAPPSPDAIRIIGPTDPCATRHLVETYTHCWD